METRSQSGQIQTGEASALRRLLGCVGQKNHGNPSTLTLALGHLFQRRNVASRVREKDTMLLPSHRFWESVIGT